MHGFVVEFQLKEDRDYYVTEDKAHRGFVEWATGGGFVEEARVVGYEVHVY
jgi:Stress responsive A/B Barrel Domain